MSTALSHSFVKQKARIRERTAEMQDMLYLPPTKELTHTPFLAAPGFFFPMREDLSSAKGGKQQISRRELI